MVAPKSWCDKLASVPTAGLKLVPHFTSSDSIIDSLSPLLDQQMNGDKAAFAITQQTSFELQFQMDNGFHYFIEPTKWVVSFRHRMRTKPTSGGPPIMEMLSHPLPYTKLLQDACDRLVETATLLSRGTNDQLMNRVGLISLTTVDMDEAPPGLIRFLEYVGRPWKSSLDHFDITVMADLGTSKGWRDRCIHTLKKSEESGSLLSVQLDWQRVYETNRHVTSDVLRPLLANCREDALKYFEDVAEGSRFDEELIGETARV